MFGWARATVVLASSTKRRTKSSSQASSSRICFTTSFFSNPPAPRSVARTTRAIPPRASSRSSTYLPKTWGYIQSVVRSRSQRHRSIHGAFPALAALVVAAGAACSKDAVVTTRQVVANVPAGCAVDGKGYATYFALGDFEPAAPPPGPYLSQGGEVLTQVDTRAQALVVSASENGSTWEGVAGVPPSGDVNVLVLPQDLSCALTTQVGARTGSTLAAIGSQQALLVGGTDPSNVPIDFVIDLDSGQVAQARPGLPFQRTQASVTPFGQGGLVAGGVALRTALPTTDAQVFDSTAGGFTSSLTLSEARAGHAAVVLVNGSTLLVGGVGGVDGKTPIPRMEVVTKGAGNGSEEGVALLNPVLKSPVALRLASGEILVAGGTSVGGVAATSLQWFLSDASMQSATPQTLPAGSGFSIVALEAGGALAVVAPPTSMPANFQTTWVIGADHSVTAAMAVQGTLTRPVLFGGAGGAPLLWTGDRWLQWQPWAGAFTSAPVLDSAPANLGDAFTSPDPGLAMWLDPVRTRLVALRWDTSNVFSADPSAYLAQDSIGVAPDALPAGGTVTYTGGTGLSMAQGAGAFVTDRTYADVSIRVTFAAGQAPFVVLRDDQGTPHVVDGTCCPGLLTAQGSTPSLDVERTGATVTCAVNDAVPQTCSWTLDASARVAVGVQGVTTTSPSIVSEIVVKRLGAP